MSTRKLDQFPDELLVQIFEDVADDYTVSHKFARKYPRGLISLLTTSKHFHAIAQPLLVRTLRGFGAVSENLPAHYCKQLRYLEKNIEDLDQVLHMYTWIGSGQTFRTLTPWKVQNLLTRAVELYPECSEFQITATGERIKADTMTGVLLALCPKLETLHFEIAYASTPLVQIFARLCASNIASVTRPAEHPLGLSNLKCLLLDANVLRNVAEEGDDNECPLLLTAFKLPSLVQLTIQDGRFVWPKSQAVESKTSNLRKLYLKQVVISNEDVGKMLHTCKALKVFNWAVAISDTIQPNRDLHHAFMHHGASLEQLCVTFGLGLYVLQRVPLADLMEILYDMKSLKEMTLSYMELLVLNVEVETNNPEPGHTVPMLYHALSSFLEELIIWHPRDFPALHTWEQLEYILVILRYSGKGGKFFSLKRLWLPACLLNNQPLGKQSKWTKIWQEHCNFQRWKDQTYRSCLEELCTKAGVELVLNDYADDWRDNDGESDESYFSSDSE